LQTSVAGGDAWATDHMMEHYDPIARYIGLESCIKSMGFDVGSLYGLGISSHNG